MKSFFLLAFMIMSLGATAQLMGGTMYVAAKTGLSIREKPETGAKVLDKIPYGTKITLLEYGEEKKSIVTEGILGYWQKVKFNNKTGYIVDTYLFPWAPPKLATIKEMKNYLSQVTVPYGGKLIVKSGNMNNMEEGGWEIQKQLYKNGAEWHRHLGYEYGSDVYFLPGFSLQQGFLLLRLIPEFKEVFGEKDVFPTESKTFKKGEVEYELKVEKEMFGDAAWYTKIKMEYADGAFYMFEMYLLDNQLVIFFGSGV
ncbi:MAG: SH3 domain-containing protein [Chitinophagaceae bacterium]|nr:SH3 domain-containing protein [Chitinophagaceae bacterium]MBL0274093.1 SH3 domain-containing protein [Chitinophagaceae bacterium]